MSSIFSLMFCLLRMPFQVLPNGLLDEPVDAFRPRFGSDTQGKRQFLLPWPEVDTQAVNVHARSIA